MKLITVDDARNRPFPAMDVRFEAASFFWNLPRSIVPAEYWHDAEKGLPGVYFQLEADDPSCCSWAWRWLAAATLAEFLLANGVDRATVEAWRPRPVTVIPATTPKNLAAALSAIAAHG